jgi:hypothetical protein
MGIRGHRSPLAELDRAVANRDEAQRMIGAQVLLCRAAGESWASVAVVLGISKQAAQQRYCPASERRRAATEVVRSDQSLKGAPRSPAENGAARHP